MKTIVKACLMIFLCHFTETKLATNTKQTNTPYAGYCIDEAPTGNRCMLAPFFISNDYYCDGMRTCSSSGWCVGTSRYSGGCVGTKIPGVNYSAYIFNEGPTGNRCTYGNDWKCDGNRTCSSFGWCTGTSRPSGNCGNEGT